MIETAREQAKRTILEIVRLSPGRKVQGRVRLYKAFYIAHLFYWQKHRGTLTDYPVVHMPYGPGVDRGHELTAELQEEGKLKIGRQMRGPYPEDVFRIAGSFKSELPPAKREAIEKALRWVGKKSAAVLSSETHLSRSWNAAGDGQEMAIYLDVLPEDEYRRIQESVSQTADRLKKVFSNRP